MIFIRQCSLVFFLAATAAFADDFKHEKNLILDNSTEVDLADFLWFNRPIVVLADSPDDPRYIKQMALLMDNLEELKTRDVVILTDTDPSQKTRLRKRLRPRGFMLVLIGKDGSVKLRKPFPWDVRAISRAIDKMPMRRQEMRDGG